MVATHLFEQLQHPAMNTALLIQCAVELFALEQSVAVCLYPLDPNETVFAATSNRNELTSKKRGLRLDPEYCDPHIELSEDLLTTACTTTTKWCTVLATENLSPGFHKWDVVINKCTNTCNIMIGLCERSQNLAYYVGQDTNALGECMKF